MPRLTVLHPRGQGATGQGGRGGGLDRACKWMEEAKEGGPAERHRKLESFNQTPPGYQALKKLSHLKSWYSFALVVAVWSVCQVEAPLYPSVNVTWMLVLVCLVWMVLGACFHALKSSLRPGQNQGEPPGRLEKRIVSANRNIQWAPRPRGPGPGVPLALALADSLLQCVLQEPLPDPSVPHIKTLICRLESLFHTLQKADIGSEDTTLAVDYDPKVTDKVKLIQTYLQQRLTLLCRLVSVQWDFEASVKDMLEGLDSLWAQLEELHTGVTLTKEGSQDHRDLASALTDAETLFAVLGRYRTILRCCQTHLKDSTQLLQELTWSHTHFRNRVRSSSSESVWPELLLQSNMEQFDKVQENFLSMEHQTSTFQAHLEGLREETQEGRAGLLRSGSVSSQTSSTESRNGVASPERHSSPSASTPVPQTVKTKDREINAVLSLCERSAQHLSSTIGRLRRSGRRKLSSPTL
ncbi:uncharacterized protein si:ch211-151h10.2 [Xyrichtys novacula]|uniref:Uncharacterized protein si:ch211-151h10.2 n=1 Tax=Xyrichtys novacula TaxID=13765 RepID=A0AAV1FWB6_XYRNO|nr:uncharacterized protein si:ch211-151h10.2 [Xyrichtys novacula]